MVTFSFPSNPTELQLDYNTFPNSSCKTLIARNDLGRGASGKAWLTCTTSNPASVCVLKFHNDNDWNELEREKENWHKIYPEFVRKVKVEKWSGEYALMMPHFSDIAKEDYLKFKDHIRSVLMEKFANNQVVHTDVTWNNIGSYKDKHGTIIPVVYDLESVRLYQGNNSDWIDRAMLKLYPVKSMLEII